MLLPTFRAAPSRGLALALSTERAIEALLARSPRAIEAIGICLGGIVRDGEIAPSSGVTLGMSDTEYQETRTIGLRMRGRFKIPVTIAQDAFAKAYFHSALHDCRQCLVLDIGTSTGGAYIDSAGALPPYLNQVGRMAFDLSDDARPRADGMGRGLLSQYLSASGIMTLAGSLGLTIRTPQDLEARLSGPIDGTVRRLTDLVRDQLLDAVALLCEHYALTQVVLTGGVVSGELGRLLVAGLPSAAAMPTIRLSSAPQYDASIGAAWIALSNAEKGSQPFERGDYDTCSPHLEAR